MRGRILFIVVGALATMTLSSAGCTTAPDVVRGANFAQNSEACGSEGCHGELVESQATAAHSDLSCLDCHDGTTEAHGNDPEKVTASIDWRIDACAGCHRAEAETYLYDDNAQVGPFGGSQRKPPQPKTDLYPQYNTIVAGHGFTREYNEEGAHAFMLEDHYETARGKFESCVQCKSTKVSYVWGTGRPLRVADDTDITLTHTAAPGVAARVVTIPKDTVITYATTTETAQVDAKATFPDGTEWSSRPEPSADATQNYNMVWASTIAAIKETLPYGAGCNHCHDPHTGGERLVRKAMLTAIEGDGGPKGTGGVNPYRENSTKDWSNAPKKDRHILMCAQCHVEYVCGKSGVDGIDRDYFSWAKATDLHDLYSARFDYSQDWRHALMGEPLIKSQHPETELYWESPHYDAGVSCSDCHMPQVRDRDGRLFRSHWFTSPYKYRDDKTWTAFTEKTSVRANPSGNPCTRCHSDRTEDGIAQQRAFFARQAQIEKLLAESVSEFAKLKAAKDAKKRVDDTEYARALEAHRRAHVIWENLAVSENSMGFHNFGEAMSALDEAEKQVRTAIGSSRKALSPQ